MEFFEPEVQSFRVLYIAFLLQKAAYRAGFETLLVGVLSSPYPISNEATHPAHGG